MQIEITNEIHQNWIDAEGQMANFYGDDHPAVYSHNLIGQTIYGEKLEEVRSFIADNCGDEITIEQLQHFQSK